MKIKKMRTEDTVAAWIANCVSNREDLYFSAHSCHGYMDVFYSYCTPICRFVNGKFLLNARKYSVTTSKLQTYFRRHLSKGFKWEEVDSLQ